MALAPESQLVDGHVVANSGHHILQDAPTGFVEENVVRHHRRHAHLGSKIGKFVEPNLVVGPTAQGQGQISAFAEGFPQATQLQGTGVIGSVRDKNGDQALGIVGQVAPLEMALRLSAAFLAQGQQTAQPGIGGAVGRIDQNRHAVDQIQTAADDEPDAGILGGLMGPHDAGQRIAVDYGQGLNAERRRLREQVVARAGAAQEREMAGRLQFGIARGGHAKTPCRNHLWEPVPGSSPSPAR